MEATDTRASHWATAAVPLTVALAAIGTLVAVGRPVLEAWTAGAVVGLTAAFLLVRSGRTAPAREPKLGLSLIHI